jgi:hypothetical protein
MYMIFATFNGLACIHMFLAAPETRGKTLEEMDEVFDSGRPAWRSVPEGSRLDQLAKDIEAGNVKVDPPNPERDSSSPGLEKIELTMYGAPMTTTTITGGPQSDERRLLRYSR